MWRKVDPELFSKRGKFKMHLALIIKGLKEHGKPLLGDFAAVIF